MMSLPVVTVASGGLPVVDVTALPPMRGRPVTEAANGLGIAVTKVAAGGMPVVYDTIGAGSAALRAAMVVGVFVNGLGAARAAFVNGVMVNLG